MQALHYPAWEQLELVEMPIPELAADEVLLKVAACGICGSELEGFKNHSPRRKPPRVMGHEFCGIVADVGTAVNGIEPGTRLISNSVATCGSCKPCLRGNTHLCERRQIFGMHRAGAFAEYVNVPANCLIAWPENLPAEAACLAEPLANGVHVVNLVRHLRPQKVVVIGAGPIGLMCQQAAQVLLGAEVLVTDFITERICAARELGASALVQGKTQNLGESVAAWTDGEGTDVVIDAAGSASSKRISLDITRPGGAVVWIGLHENDMSLATYDITLPEKLVFGSYAATLNELKEAVRLMATGMVEVQSWVQRFPLSQGVEAFHRMLAAKGDDIKAVLLP